METPYSQQYAQLESKALVAIVRTPDDYQPQAVQAAQTELTARGISSKEYERLFAEWQAEQQPPFRGSLIEQLSSLARVLTRVYHSIQRHLQKLNSVVVLASIASIYAVLGLWSSRWLVTMWFTDDFAWMQSLFLDIIAALWMPIAAVLLWRKNKVGWMMLVLYVPIGIVQSVGWWIFWIQNPGMFQTESFFAALQPSLTATIRNFIISIAVPLFACRASLREQFQVSRLVMWACIAASLLFGATLWFSLFGELFTQQ